ncbi:MAG: hypothetical protein N2250_09540, partial [Pseudothermotoga sp.]|nr:hypothetical protein [Pseudothermotoga sp.]
MRDTIDCCDCCGVYLIAIFYDFYIVRLRRNLIDCYNCRGIYFLFLVILYYFSFIWSGRKTIIDIVRLVILFDVIVVFFPTKV